MEHRAVTVCAVFLWLSDCVATSVGGGPPTDNPVAAHYSGGEGYPAWTDSIRWANVIDMKAYRKGETEFERFENARDGLAAKGGGVLYYPAGTYDFSAGPMDGPHGRGLMLRSGVVIRGQAPAGRPSAFRDGKLDLPTKFVFGFRKYQGGSIPRDWNVIGLMPQGGRGVRSVHNVGICWVHCVGAVVYFGPDVNWGKTWAQSDSWRGRRAAGAWKDRKPDGTHPFDPFGGGGREYVGMGRGRLVFGCILEDACVDSSHLDIGHHPQRFCGRVAVYGSRVLVANNVLPKSRRVFKYTRGGLTELYDYGRTIGIDINKNLLGWCRDEGRCPGYFAEGVLCRDNWVYNHGNKGYEIAGAWVAVRNCHNERDYLRSGSPKAYGIGGWVLTLDGRKKSGGASDNMSRAFDLGGGPIWIDGCTMNNTGSHPGNDGEGILCQRHGGTDVHSWAITHCRHDRGDGEPGYFGGWHVHCYGLMICWNRTPGWVGNALAGNQYDCTFVPNECSSVKHTTTSNWKGKRTPGDPGETDVLLAVPKDSPKPPRNVAAKRYAEDAVGITWTDAADSELGFRVERRIGGGKWQTVAYRPRQSKGHPSNPARWVDFTAPPKRKLIYRVVACDAADSDRAAGSPTQAVRLP